MPTRDTFVPLAIKIRDKSNIIVNYLQDPSSPFRSFKFSDSWDKEQIYQMNSKYSDPLSYYNFHISQGHVEQLQKDESNLRCLFSPLLYDQELDVMLNHKSLLDEIEECNDRNLRSKLI